MDLGRLKRLVDALVAEQGKGAPVAAFIYTAADVADATSGQYFLRIILGLTLQKSCWNYRPTQATRRLKTKSLKYLRS